MDTTPYWIDSQPMPAFPTLNSDLDVDVVVVGGGLTGITAAYLFKRAGARVALIERQRCATADTGHTTAHLTMVTDERLHQVARRFGKDAARAFWEAGAAAIDQIHDNITREKIACDFKWVPGYLHASLRSENRDDYETLAQDATLARALGFDAEFVEVTPYCNRPGVRFDHQARFHPRQYLSKLLRCIEGEGSYVFENSAVTEFNDSPLSVKACGHTVRCQFLFLATHTPLMGNTGMFSALLLQTKLAPYTSYVLGARLPHGAIPEALFWDTSDPYYYLRVDRHAGYHYAIFGGEDAKTGQEDDPQAVFRRLEDVFKTWVPYGQVTHRWLGQVVETNDGLPLIGATAENQFVATGYHGNGFTLGTVAAMMARDAYLKRTNPWQDLFDVHRKKLLGGTWRYITENKDFPYHLLRDRLAPAASNSVDEIAPGHGKIVNLDGQKVAAYRDPRGELTLLSPVCTHLKCIVRWNDADQTWDCPCHGSRFKPTGEVFSGPAEKPLPRCEQVRANFSPVE
jgi:glycine/D-amino acid oxidase-like deaminating enzyme/nitrite reductase/ring-hydroxylating ferredoxin subunit